ncbi:MAG: hypothetical protein NC300_03150 [Bacteroidales bacterium]|nr:hypothetical protein [Clostridium sp.]MCM1203115.1 hypothetical protein [Bacteroidales bacterium]
MAEEKPVTDTCMLNEAEPNLAGRYAEQMERSGIKVAWRNFYSQEIYTLFFSRYMISYVMTWLV